MSTRKENRREIGMADLRDSLSTQDFYSLVSSQDLRAVEDQVNKFNPFAVLGVEKYEVRHSNVLSWLFNPNELHGYGDSFLRSFMAEVIVGNDNAPDEFTLTDTYFIDYDDAEVRREWGHIDILVISRKQKTVLLIENKILAKESDGQLQAYLDLCKKTFLGYRILPVYLTLEGDEPQGDERYCWLSHRRVVDVIESELGRVRHIVSAQVADFILFYISTIKGMLGMDDKLEALCRKIYHEHRAALDAIISVADKTSFVLREATEDYLQQNSNIRVTWQNPKQTWLVDASWGNLDWVADEKWNQGFPVAMWFSEYNGNLKLVLEVGPVTPAGERLRFLEHLERAGFRISERAKSPDRKYSRVYTNRVEVSDWGDREELAGKMADLLEIQGKDAVKRFSDAIRSFDWGAGVS
jgi:hypothetical protein